MDSEEVWTGDVHTAEDECSADVPLVSLMEGLSIPPTSGGNGRTDRDVV
jgi:hypothetical protein